MNDNLTTIAEQRIAFDPTWDDIMEFSTPEAIKYKPGMRVRSEINGRRGGGIVTEIIGDRIMLRPCTIDERKELWSE